MTASLVSGLYAITPDAEDGACLISAVEACLAGGARVLQYRNKIRHAPHLEIARQLKSLCQHYRAIFIINDSVELALACNADGVHIGMEDSNISICRQALGAKKWIGTSCYGDFSRALSAQRAGANYVAFGSVFLSGTKPNAPRASLELFSQAKQALTIPVVAIGGITLQNAPEVISAGADAVATISAVFGASDVKNAAENFSNLFIHQV